MADTQAQISAQPTVSEEFKAVRPCAKCGTADRNKSGKCKACKKLLDANRAAKNPEKKKALAAAWYAANAERLRIAHTEYRAENLEKRRASSVAYQAKNKAHISAKNRAARKGGITAREKASQARYRAANPEKRKAARDAWAAANPGAIRINKQNRRARKKAAGGKLSRGLTQKLFQFQQGQCPCCKQPLGNNYHLDHIVPLALGGTNTDDNMQLLRARCNLQKSAKHPIAFMQERGFLL